MLAGFQHILVDEYQDIDEPQYEMISAIAGRTLDDADLKLSILAVGDDDQNIYTFRGANVEFIRRFQQDYEAEVHYLVENYRSTRYIIEAANRLIAANVDRMKTEHPIRIDRHREMLPPAGSSASGTPEPGQGAGDSGSGWREPGQAVLAELRRLRELGVTDWSAHGGALQRASRPGPGPRAGGTASPFPSAGRRAERHAAAAPDPGNTPLPAPVGASRVAPFTRASDLLADGDCQVEADPQIPGSSF